MTGVILAVLADAEREALELIFVFSDGLLRRARWGNSRTTSRLIPLPGDTDSRFTLRPDGIVNVGNNMRISEQGLLSLAASVERLGAAVFVAAVDEANVIFAAQDASLLEALRIGIGMIEKSDDQESETRGSEAA